MSYKGKRVEKYLIETLSIEECEKLIREIFAQHGVEIVDIIDFPKIREKMFLRVDGGDYSRESLRQEVEDFIARYIKDRKVIFVAAPVFGDYSKIYYCHFFGVICDGGFIMRHKIFRYIRLWVESDNIR